MARRLIYSENLEGFEHLRKELENMARYARLEGYTEPAIEARTLPVDRQLRPHVELYEEILTDQSKQLVAVVIA